MDIAAVYEKHKHLKLAADELGMPWQTLYRQLKAAGWHPGRTDDDLTDIIRAKGAELAALKASQEPVAHLKFWAYQRNLGDGNVDHDTGFEVCQAGEIGDDKSPAFPVFAAPVPAATWELTRALEWIEEAVMLVGCESWSAALENEGRAILAAAKETK